MAWDWGDAGGGAVTGASTGAALGSVVPGVGTLIGGAAGALIGGIAGGLSGHDDTPTYKDPLAGERYAALQEALHSHVGADSAAKAAGDLRHSATKAYENFSSNPNFAGNAAVQAAGYNQIQRQAESGMIDANLKGAEMDQAAKMKAMGLASDESKFDYDVWRDRLGRASQPSVLQSILAKNAGAIAGKGADALSAALSGGNAATGEGSVNTTALDAIGRSYFG